MATTATATVIFAFSTSPFQRKLINPHPCLKQRRLRLPSPISCAPSNRNHVVAAQFKMPDENKRQLPTAKDKIWQYFPRPVKELPWKKAEDVLLQAKDVVWQYVPRPVKDFPWKKTEDVFLQRLFLLAQDILKWSFIAWFCSSFAFDIIFAVSRNQELIMCLTLFLGCLLSDFRMEMFKYLFPNSEVEDLRRELVVVGCFCIALKLIAQAVAIPVQGRVFLLHVVNGGLMQLLWLWRRSSKLEQNLDQENWHEEPGETFKPTL